MKWLRSSVVWIFAGLCVVSILRISMLLRREPSKLVCWLATSRPLISYAYSSTGVTARVAFDVTNSGPRPVEVFAEWYEVRGMADQRLAWPQFGPHAEVFSLPIVDRYLYPTGE